ncbi:hypothetical protein B0H19DRAFT_1130781 [Mycena capillaripes]|nr:hypothetical protein B0H19DRAFT_1130781 [Mycena capillaripes]
MVGPQGSQVEEDIRQVVQSRMEPHAAFVHCAKPHGKKQAFNVSVFFSLKHCRAQDVKKCEKVEWCRWSWSHVPE